MISLATVFFVLVFTEQTLGIFFCVPGVEFFYRRSGDVRPSVHFYESIAIRSFTDTAYFPAARMAATIPLAS